MKELWDIRYKTENYIYGVEPNDYFREKIQKLIPGRILLPADGEGRNSVFAASQAWKADAFDQSETGRAKALRLADDMGAEIDYRVADLVDFDFGEERYDAVGLFFFHLPDGLRKFLHHKVVKSLKPGGHLILEAFHKKQIDMHSGGPSNPEWLFGKKMLLEDFQALEIIEFEKLSRRIEEGKMHSGEAELVRLFGRKR